MEPLADDESKDLQRQRNAAVGTHFRDGRRKIDYVIVQEELLGLSTAASRANSPSSQGNHQPGNPSPLLTASNPSNKQTRRKADHRQVFLDKLKAQGLEVEEVKRKLVLICKTWLMTAALCAVRSLERAQFYRAEWNFYFPGMRLDSLNEETAFHLQRFFDRNVPKGNGPTFALSNFTLRGRYLVNTPRSSDFGHAWW